MTMENFLCLTDICNVAVMQLPGAFNNPPRERVISIGSEYASALKYPNTKDRTPSGLCIVYSV